MIVCGAELNSAPFIRSDIDGSTKNRGEPCAFRFKRLPESKVRRYDTFMHYYDRYADYLCAGKLPLNDLAFNYKAYGLPCFETIRRARQRVQSLFPEYSRSADNDDNIVIIIGVS